MITDNSFHYTLFEIEILIHFLHIIFTLRRDISFWKKDRYVQI